MSSYLDTSSHESSRRRTTESQKDLPEVQEELKFDEDNVSSRNWFTFMFSCPIQKHMSTIEVFTFWSAILVYFPIGVLSMLDAKTPSMIFRIQSGKYSDGIARISGMQTAVVAFLHIIFSRASPCISSNCIILATVFERIVIVNSLLFLILWQQLVPVQFLLSVMIMDTGLSIIITVLWFHESEVASIGKFFSNIIQVMSLDEPSSHYSSRAVQMLGLVQLFLGSLMVALPNLINQLLYLNANDLDGHSQGLLSVCHMTTAVVGCIHFFSGGADSKAYNIASIFYRVVLSIPFLVVLGMLNQIPFTLMGYFVCLDAISLLVVSLSLCFDTN
ncbi:uncharacterized protein LOC116295157 [Actinia tenebrosa]|uniref:Uncharacterized protein LOC116295157 n=1 Tax=Actinia tenebrosa TaxID=6105 RepID=A0A6P8I1K2_ACTTE|nr:uncharacterized protein LOC116295157 [Actinia tenebrosa]XP_031558772.1 uncharacterized protein LOC116295157 [Actinia tenebrosa]XP_031558774.1 uncharacterized protein LOC116295157 [Actinia tenebrosa]